MSPPKEIVVPKMVGTSFGPKFQISQNDFLANYLPRLLCISGIRDHLLGAWFCTYEINENSPFFRFGNFSIRRSPAPGSMLSKSRVGFIFIQMFGVEPSSLASFVEIYWFPPHSTKTYSVLFVKRVCGHCVSSICYYPFLRYTVHQPKTHRSETLSLEDLVVKVSGGEL